MGKEAQLVCGGGRADELSRRRIFFMKPREICEMLKLQNDYSLL